MQQTIDAPSTWFSPERFAWVDRLSRQLVYRLFGSLKTGHLTVISPDGTDHFGDTASEFSATMYIKKPSVYRAIALGGSIAAGETYFDEHWSTPDLVQLLRLFVKNLSVSQQMERGIARLFSDTFIRKWEYYFAYCEAGFTECSIRTDQIMFAKPGCR